MIKKQRMRGDVKDRVGGPETQLDANLDLTNLKVLKQVLNDPDY